MVGDAEGYTCYYVGFKHVFTNHTRKTLKRFFLLSCEIVVKNDIKDRRNLSKDKIYKIVQ